jgi:hypothetical protein
MYLEDHLVWDNRFLREWVGLPIGYFYGYKTDGIFQNQAEVNAHPSQIALGANAAAGDIRYVDVNGDGVLDANDRTNLGIQYRKRLWDSIYIELF